MKLLKSVFSVLTLTLVFTACKNIDFKKTKGGVPYKIFPEGKSKDTIAMDNIVKYHMIVKVKDVAKGKDSILTNSYHEFPKYIQVAAPSNSYDNPLVEIITKAKKGDSIYFVQAMDSFIAHNPQILQQTPFKKGDQLISTIRITEVFKNPEQAQADYMKERAAVSDKFEKDELKSFGANPQAQEQMKTDSKIIEDYLAANHIQAQKTPWGVYVQIIEPGQGPKPSFGKYASVRYTGTTLKGEVFDSGVYPLQIGMGGSIKGFEEGVKQLAKGGKAKVFIPSVLAYGQRGNEPKVKPNENLIFDLELLDISNTAPAPDTKPNIDTTQVQK